MRRLPVVWHQRDQQIPAEELHVEGPVHGRSSAGKKNSTGVMISVNMAI
jgi:hypothetical protein